MEKRDAYSIPEFAQRNGIGRSTVYEEIKSGRLRALKVGNRTIITDEHGAEWRAALPELKTSPDATR